MFIFFILFEWYLILKYFSATIHLFIFFLCIFEEWFQFFFWMTFVWQLTINQIQEQNDSLKWSWLFYSKSRSVHRFCSFSGRNLPTKIWVRRHSNYLTKILGQEFGFSQTLQCSVTISRVKILTIVLLESVVTLVIMTFIKV